MFSSVCVKHKNSLLLKQHNGDAPQNYTTVVSIRRFFLFSTVECMVGAKNGVVVSRYSAPRYTGHLHMRQLLTADKEQLRQTLPKSHLSRKNTNNFRHFCLYTSQVAVYWLRLLRQTKPWQWLVSQRGGPGFIPYHSMSDFWRTK